MPDDPATPDPDPVVTLVAMQLGLALPAECVLGVRQNLALLAQHMAVLRGAAPPE